MLISAAVAALIFAYSAPTRGAGASHSQKSGGASKINPGGNASGSSGLNDIKAGEIKHGGGNATPQATITISHPDGHSTRITNKSTDDKGNTTVHTVVQNSNGTVTENTTRVYGAQGNEVKPCQGTKC